MFLYDDDDDAVRRAMWPFVNFLATCLFGVQQNAAGVDVADIDTHKKLSYRRRTAQRAMSVEILSSCCITTRKIPFDRRMTLKVTQGHRKWRDSIGHIYRSPLVVCKWRKRTFAASCGILQMYTIRYDTVD